MQKFFHNKNIISTLVVLFVFGISIFFTSPASSSINDNIYGFAWGADEVNDTTFNPKKVGGIGWISFNSTDCDTDRNGFIDAGNCGSNNSSVPVVNYGVNVDITGNTGYITGYAWSSEGWIKFGGFSTGEFPVTTGINATNAKLNLANNKVYGWARICAYTANPINCSGKAPRNAYTGGVDGWISLNSEEIDLTNPLPSVYSVTYDSGLKEFKGWGWAGDSGEFDTPPICDTCNRISLGWISFNCLTDGTGCANSNYKVKYNGSTDPVVTITATPNPVAIGSSTVLSWNGINLKNDPLGCETDFVGTPPPNPSDIGWLTNKPAPSGTYNTMNLPQGSYDYKIRCKDLNGVFSLWATVTVVSGDTTLLDFYAVPSVATPPDFNTTLKWRDSPDIPGLTGCVADSGYPLNIDSVPGWQGSKANPSSSANQLVDVPYDITKYKITCNNGTGQQLSQIISVKRKFGESIKLTATKPVGNFSTLSWVTTNMEANSCVGTSNPSQNSWNENNNPKTPTDAGSTPNVYVPPNTTTTYTLTCKGFYSGQDLSASIVARGGKFGKPGYKEN
ncbi:MAG: hypothetical protein M3P22_02615 [bacterium]|nr:hypothetical protein [bacterium]